MTGSITVHFRIAWAAFKANWRVFVRSVLILFGTWVSLEVAVVAVHRWGVIPNLALHLGFLFLFSGLMVGIQSMALQVVDGFVPTLRSLPALLERGPSFLFACCLYIVAVACGFLLLVVPGVYLGVRYAPFGYVIGSRQVSGLEALREAGALTQDRWWKVCSFLLVLLALNLAGAALLGLGLLVSFPVSLLAVSSFLRNLEHLTGTSQSAALVCAPESGRSETGLHSLQLCRCAGPSLSGSRRAYAINSQQAKLNITAAAPCIRGPAESRRNSLALRGRRFDNPANPRVESP